MSSSSSSSAVPPSSSTSTTSTSLPAIAQPIVFGSVARFLGRKQNKVSPQATHSWSVYVRGAQGLDITHFVSRVVFALHPSFPEPNRTLTAPPFEVHESGWGEFEVGITVHFLDDLEPPVSTKHWLKLYPDGATGSTAPTKNKPVTSELYDEIVLERPHERLRAALMEGGAKAAKASAGANPSQHSLWTRFSESSDLARLAAAQDYVRRELVSLHRRVAVLFNATSSVMGAKVPARFAHTPVPLEALLMRKPAVKRSRGEGGGGSAAGAKRAKAGGAKSPREGGGAAASGGAPPASRRWKEPKGKRKKKKKK